jgi:hypothetical protein
MVKPERRLSATERQCLNAMRNAPHLEEEDTIAIGFNVLLGGGMGGKDAERVARGLFDEWLKPYSGAG